MSFKALEPLRVQPFVTQLFCIAYFCRTHYIFAIMRKTKTWFIDQYYYKGSSLSRSQQNVWLSYQQGANTISKGDGHITFR